MLRRLRAISCHHKTPPVFFQTHPCAPFFKHFANHKVHIGLPPKNTTNASYTVTRHKIKLQIRVNFGKLRFSKTVEKLGLQRVYRRSAEKKKRGMKKKRVICFSTPGAPTLASSRMQSLSCASVRGDGCPYKFMVGGNCSPYSPCPPNWVFCSLPPCLHQQLPPLPFPSFFLPFSGSSF